MYQIRKYCLQDSANQYGKVTKVGLGKVLLIAEQNNLLHAWIEVDVNADGTQSLYVLSTGEHFNSQEHVGSGIVGPFVWHVYRA